MAGVGALTDTSLGRRRNRLSSPCASGSTSPTTAPTSTAGPRSRGCGRCRASCRRRWRRSCGRPTVPVVCAGRTDTGVHARGQVVHVDVDEAALAGRPAARRRRSRRCCAGSTASSRPTCGYAAWPRRRPGFDARFSALWRRYAYRIADAPATLDPLTRSHVLAWPRPLDLDAMNDGVGAAGRPRTTSRRSASSARGRPRSAPCSSCSWTRDDAGRPVAHRAGGRVLPQHGALAGRLPDRGRRGPAAGRRGPARSCAPRQRDPAVAVVPAARPHARGGRLPAPTTSWRRGPSRPGRRRAADADGRALLHRRPVGAVQARRRSPARCGATS